MTRTLRILGYVVLGALVAFMFVAGVEPFETHPTCQSRMPVINGKIRHGQPLDEREKKWFEECAK